jgi:LmbE family N-acetylglucosaminyl deacetylase
MLGLQPLGFAAVPARRLRHHLDAAADDIGSAIGRCEGNALWVPAFEGAHQDHDAANALASVFFDRLPVREFAAYNFAGCRVRSNRFPEECGAETVIDASPDEAALKRRALACYASERGNLRHIGADREACRPLPAYDYGAPPHSGLLFRERFKWVPFRHPRIDFASSADVYRDIDAWVSARRPRRPPPLGDAPGGETGQPDREFAGALDQAER